MTFYIFYRLGFLQAYYLVSKWNMVSFQLAVQWLWHSLIHKTANLSKWVAFLVVNNIWQALTSVWIIPYQVIGITAWNYQPLGQAVGKTLLRMIRKDPQFTVLNIIHILYVEVDVEQTLIMLIQIPSVNNTYSVNYTYFIHCTIIYFVHKYICCIFWASCDLKMSYHLSLA